MKKIILSAAFTASLLCGTSALADDSRATTGIGIEGFSDSYHEPSIDVNTTSTYGSVTGYYSYERSRAFGAVDGRVSYGTTDYKSSSGEVSGIPEWEFEGRGRVGYSFPLWGGNLSPYSGLGVRYFMQQGKGRYTTLFAGAYDRRILQAYIPIGASLAFTTGSGWTITPSIEYDQLVYGQVSSRLGSVSPLYPNVNNKQTSGYGIRGDLMFGKASNNYAWQFGPFIRYWNIKDSDTTCSSNSYGTICGLEPKNDRTQIGIAARVLW